MFYFLIVSELSCCDCSLFSVILCCLTTTVFFFFWRNEHRQISFLAPLFYSIDCKLETDVKTEYVKETNCGQLGQYHSSVHKLCLDNAQFLLKLIHLNFSIIGHCQFFLGSLNQLPIKIMESWGFRHCCWFALIRFLKSSKTTRFTTWQHDRPL